MADASAMHARQKNEYSTYLEYSSNLHLCGHHEFHKLQSFLTIQSQQSQWRQTKSYEVSIFGLSQAGTVRKQSFYPGKELANFKQCLQETDQATSRIIVLDGPAHYGWRNDLTLLAFIFIPISLATSIFGMNIQEINGSGHKTWVFVVTTIALLLAVGGLFALSKWTIWYRRYLVSSRLDAIEASDRMMGSQRTMVEKMSFVPADGIEMS